MKRRSEGRGGIVGSIPGGLCLIVFGLLVGATGLETRGISAAGLDCVTESCTVSFDEGNDDYSGLDCSQNLGLPCTVCSGGSGAVGNQRCKECESYSGFCRYTGFIPGGCGNLKEGICGPTSCGSLDPDGLVPCGQSRTCEES